MDGAVAESFRRRPICILHHDSLVIKHCPPCCMGRFQEVCDDFMGIFKCQLEKGLRKSVKSGSPAITAPIARSLIFLYRCESVISRVGRTSIVGLLWAAEMLICRDRGVSTTAQRGDTGAMVSRQSAIFPLEARVIILIILM